MTNLIEARGIVKDFGQTPALRGPRSPAPQISKSGPPLRDSTHHKECHRSA